MSELTPEVVAPDQQGWKGGRSADTDGLARLTQKLRALEQQVAQLRGAAPLRAAGVHVAPEGMTIDSNLAVTGTLSLPAGIIDNDALANPVTFRSSYASQEGFGVTTTYTGYGTVTIPVPVGFTSAMITAFATMAVRNTTDGPAIAFVRCRAESSTEGRFSGSQEVAVAAGGWGSQAAPLAHTFSGLTAGENLRFMTWVMGSVALGVDAGNYASTQVAVVFGR